MTLILTGSALPALIVIRPTFASFDVFSLTFTKSELASFFTVIHSGALKDQSFADVVILSLTSILFAALKAMAEEGSTVKVSFLGLSFVQETIVSGTSMMPTLENADKVLIDKVIYKADDLKRYDIIVFDYNHSNVYVKRIVGLPGEKVMIIEGEVYVNGKKLRDDPLLNDTMEYAGIAENSIQLGEDEYFVLGDNRNNSYDSRYEQVGIVNKSSIIGRVWLRLFPISKFGAVK